MEHLPKVKETKALQANYLCRLTVGLICPGLVLWSLLKELMKITSKPPTSSPFLWDSLLLVICLETFSAVLLVFKVFAVVFSLQQHVPFWRTSLRICPLVQISVLGQNLFLCVCVCKHCCKAFLFSLGKFMLFLVQNPSLESYHYHFHSTCSSVIPPCQDMIVVLLRLWIVHRWQLLVL